MKMGVQNKSWKIIFAFDLSLIVELFIQTFIRGQQL